jgi:hypothetical protein
MDRKPGNDLKVTPWKIAVCVAIAMLELVPEICTGR